MLELVKLDATVFKHFQVISDDNSQGLSCLLFMPPSKKLRGHIGLGLSLSACVHNALYTVKNS